MLDKTTNAVEEDCGRVAILVASLRIPPRCGQAGLTLDRDAILAASSIAIYARPSPGAAVPQWRVVPGRDPRITRPWLPNPVSSSRTDAGSAAAPEKNEPENPGDDDQ
jgi:hypothetical protein